MNFSFFERFGDSKQNLDCLDGKLVSVKLGERDSRRVRLAKIAVVNEGRKVALRLSGPVATKTASWIGGRDQRVINLSGGTKENGVASTTVGEYQTEIMFKQIVGVIVLMMRGAKIGKYLCRERCGKLFFLSNITFYFQCSDRNTTISPLRD